MRRRKQLLPAMCLGLQPLRYRMGYNFFLSVQDLALLPAHFGHQEAIFAASFQAFGPQRLPSGAILQSAGTIVYPVGHSLNPKKSPSNWLSSLLSRFQR